MIRYSDATLTMLYYPLILRSKTSLDTATATVPWLRMWFRNQTLFNTSNQWSKLRKVSRIFFAPKPNTASNTDMLPPSCMPCVSLHNIALLFSYAPFFRVSYRCTHSLPLSSYFRPLSLLAVGYSSFLFVDISHGVFLRFVLTWLFRWFLPILVSFLFPFLLFSIALLGSILSLRGLCKKALGAS